MASLILKFLGNRKIYVKDPSTGMLIGSRIAFKGYPQGSPLAPILFNLYCDTIKEAAIGQVKVFQYADDLAILCTGEDTETNIDQINATLRNISTWLTGHGMSISPGKSSAIFFTRRSSRNPMRSIEWNNLNIEWKSEDKHLGFVLDRNLKWTSHIKYICNKAHKGINIMKTTCKTWWGADPLSQLMIYKTMVRSHLDYGSCLLSRANKKDLNQMDPRNQTWEPSRL